MMNGNGHDVAPPAPPRPQCVITATEWELALFEFLGKSGLKGRAGYITEIKPIVGAAFNANITTNTQIVDVTEACRLDVTKLGVLLATYFAKQPRHYGLDLTPAGYGMTPSSMDPNK